MSKHRKHIIRDEAHKKTIHIDLSDQIIPPFNANFKFDTVDFYGKDCELIPEPNPRDLDIEPLDLSSLTKSIYEIDAENTANWMAEFSKIALGNVDKKVFAYTETFKFNKVVSEFMTLVNNERNKDLSIDVKKELIDILAIYMPGIKSKIQ